MLSFKRQGDNLNKLKILELKKEKEEMRKCRSTIE